MFYRWRDGALLLFLHLQPGAKKNEWVGEHGDRLKIRIAAPPVDGKANTVLRRFLADVFAVKVQAVQIEQGDSSRQKNVCIQNPQRLPEGIEKQTP